MPKNYLLGLKLLLQFILLYNLVDLLLTTVILYLVFYTTGVVVTDIGPFNALVAFLVVVRANREQVNQLLEEDTV